MKVSIIGGGGTLGTCTAFALAVEKIADEIVLIDINRNLAAGHALDINLAMVGQGIEVRTGEYKDMSDSDVVIIVAALPSKPGTPTAEVLQGNIPIISEAAKNIRRFCPDAVVITASNPADSLNYAMYLSSHLNRGKLMGYNLNDSLRFRLAISKALGVKSDKVEGLVIGEHVGILAFLFSSVRVEGRPVSFNEDLKQQIRQEGPKLLHTFSSYNTGRTLGWTSGVGLVDMVRIIGADAEEVIPCSAILDGEYGNKGFSMGVPVILGKEGIRQILEWKLPADEKEELERAAISLKSSAKTVKQILGFKTN